MTEVWRLRTEDNEERFFWSEEEAEEFYIITYVKLMGVDEDYPHEIDLVLTDEEEGE